MKACSKTISTVILVQLFLLTALTAIFSSCQRKHEGSGGSVIGNGFIRYHDPKYDYFFDYNKDLRLIKLNTNQVKLDNANYAETRRSRTSEISFAVIDIAEKGIKSIEDYASSLSASSHWAKLNEKTISGLYFKESNDGQLKARYLFSLSNNSILDVEANAFAEAKGIALISKVIDSIDFDTQPPVIHEVKFEPSVVQAGETVKLKIRATDNMTKISGTTPNGSVSVLMEQKCRQLLTKNWEALESCGEFRSLGSDWYEFDVQTHPRMRPGSYILYPITIWDAAGNSTELMPDHERGVYQAPLTQDTALIPLQYLTVENKMADNIKPTLTGAWFEPSTIAAGDEISLIFNATDNDPNFSPLDLCDRALHREWFRYSRSDVPLNAEIDPTEYSLKACGTPLKRPDGLWELKIKSSEGLPPGEYLLELVVKDQVGNVSEIASASATVTNAKQIDVEGPKILEIKTDRSEYKPGDKGLILIKATDDISGVIDNPSYNFIKTCRQRLISSEITTRNITSDNRVPICDDSFRKIDDEWFALQFTLPDRLPTGEYLLPDISIADKVGNTTYLDSKSSGDNKGNYRNKFNDQSTDVSILKVQVKN